MMETVSAITDWLVALVCLVLLAVRNRSGTEKSPWVNIFFAFVGIAAFLGGWVHWNEARQVSSEFAWRLTTVAMAGVTLSLWRVSLLENCWPKALETTLIRFAWLQALGFGGCALLLPLPFLAIIANYFPATLFSFASSLRSTRQRARWAAIGIAVSWLAAAAQAFGWSWTTLSLDQNSVYHLIQIAGILLLARGWKELRAPGTGRALSSR